MTLKGFRIYSMLRHKCPVCHEGNLFKEVAYSRRFSEMHERCTECGFRYEQEPSFFTGAMYVSYALQVAMITTIYVALRVLLDPPTEVYMVANVVAAILLLPVTLRLSRAIYINFFFGYRGRPGSHPDAHAERP
jgi:uncharacterized protein (DUF983 family)